MTLSIAGLDLLLPTAARILAALSVMPIFGNRSVPMVLRVGLAAILAWLLVTSGSIQAGAPGGMGGLLLGMATESLIGLLLGFAASLSFWALAMAGEMVGLQMGWGFGGTIHSSLEQSPIPTSQFYTVVGTLLFLSIGGHRLLLMALANTFAAAPPYSFVIGGLQVERMVTLTASIFTGALQLALPIVGTLILTDAGLAFLARVLPQLNAWVLGLPLKVGVGLLAFWIGLPAMMLFMTRWLGLTVPNLQLMVK